MMDCMRTYLFNQITGVNVHHVIWMRVLGYGLYVRRIMVEFIRDDLVIECQSKLVHRLSLVQRLLPPGSSITVPQELPMWPCVQECWPMHSKIIVNIQIRVKVERPINDWRPYYRK